MSIWDVRTTIEISEAHRSALLRLAADRGEKGFSRIVGEAIDVYLQSLGLAEDRRDVVKLRGALSDDEAASLAERVREIRERWR
jgi:hypothetical protein